MLSSHRTARRRSGVKLPAMSSIRQRRLSILSFSLFSVWLLSFLFKGRVFFELVGQADANITLLVQAAVLPHFVGLFLCGFLTKRAVGGKMAMVVATVVCFSGTLIFFLPYSMLWYISLVAMGFFSALFVASWGYFLKLHTPSEALRPLLRTNNLHIPT